MDSKEQKKIDKIVEANFSKTRKLTRSKGAGSCSCGSCSCPGDSSSDVGSALEAVGYAGGYAGSLSYHAGIVD